MRRVPLFGLCVLSFGATPGCDPASALEPLPPGGTHVLFVGNSLTYVNDLPGTVAALGALVGDTIHVSSAVGPDLALIDHLNGGSNAVAQIRLGGWQYVVLQQGPSSTPANRDSLRLWSGMFEPLIRAAGAQPALLMVWPTTDRIAFFDDVRLGYLQAAQGVKGVFIPAGEAWRIAWTTDPSLPFYSPDGLHPSPMGTYLAALVVYERVTGHDARLLPPRAVLAGGPLTLSETVVRTLQSAAHDAVSRYR